ncbi:hypothetical protein [Variovorax sp. 38R]|uniref:hypothetical protein n=1 Tax=Variovorax sp. 38R TaxID=2774875 RepID=UPI00177FC4B5|nr:hypothetical protein [Variovorax sp. 38R]QOF80056.1 hypothetical protein IG196_06560 [Variovorax sp. 38R]
MKIQPRLLNFALPIGISIACLSGCATSTYKGLGTEALPVASLAVLENNDHMKTNIIEVDGRHRGNGFFNRYELTPGSHTLKIDLYVGIGARGTPPTIRFDVAAGETYELRYMAKVVEFGYPSTTYQWRPQIVNKRTGVEIPTQLVPVASR